MKKSGRSRVEKGIRQTSTYAMATCTVSCIVKIITAALGKTSLQIVDCARSIVETAVIVLWWAVCTSKKTVLTPEREEKIETVTRTGMVATAVLMCVYSVYRFLTGGSASGAVQSGVVLAFIFALNNINIYIGYIKRHSTLDTVEEQSRLFLVKAAADLCVCITLHIIMIWPEWKYINFFQLVSSLVVAGAMAFAGLKAARDD